MKDKDKDIESYKDEDTESYERQKTLKSYKV